MLKFFIKKFCAQTLTVFHIVWNYLFQHEIFTIKSVFNTRMLNLPPYYEIKNQDPTRTKCFKSIQHHAKGLTFTFGFALVPSRPHL
jgi:hypothetical protein